MLRWRLLRRRNLINRYPRFSLSLISVSSEPFLGECNSGTVFWTMPFRQWFRSDQCYGSLTAFDSLSSARTDCPRLWWLFARLMGVWNVISGQIFQRCEIWLQTNHCVMLFKIVFFQLYSSQLSGKTKLQKWHFIMNSISYISTKLNYQAYSQLRTLF